MAHECRHCGDTHGAVEELHGHVQEHDLHWHHCPLCGEDLMERLQDLSPSVQRAAIGRVRRQHAAEEADAAHFG